MRFHFQPFESFTIFQPLEESGHCAAGRGRNPFLQLLRRRNHCPAERRGPFRNFLLTMCRQPATVSDDEKPKGEQHDDLLELLENFTARSRNKQMELSVKPCRICRERPGMSRRSSADRIGLEKTVVTCGEPTVPAQLSSSKSSTSGRWSDNSVSGMEKFRILICGETRMKSSSLRGPHDG